jgi:hypothetical protein
VCVYWQILGCFIFTWIWMLVFTYMDLNALFLQRSEYLCLLTGIWMLYFYMDLDACFTDMDLNALFLQRSECLCLLTGIWMLYFYMYLDACFTDMDLNALFLQRSECLCLLTGIWMLYFLHVFSCKVGDKSWMRKGPGSLYDNFDHSPHIKHFKKKTRLISFNVLSNC